MNKLKYLSFLSLLMFSSCIDMFDPSPERIVGEIYLKQTVDGKRLIFGEHYSLDGKYSFIVNKPLVSLIGNDSVFYIKTNYEGKSEFYAIGHYKGITIKSTVNIDSSTYFKLMTAPKYKYTFNSNR